MLKDERKSGFNTEMTTEPVGSTKGAAARLSVLVACNLRRLRRKRGYSLERLAAISGVSRAMLGQIETEISAPTINLLGRIAEALGVSIPNLICEQARIEAIIIRRDERPAMMPGQGRFICRLRLPYARSEEAGLYEIALAPGQKEISPTCGPDVRKSLSVMSGTIDVIGEAGDQVRLEAGDAIIFGANAEHIVLNPYRLEAKAFLVVTHLDEDMPQPL